MSRLQEEVRREAHTDHAQVVAVTQEQLVVGAARTALGSARFTRQRERKAPGAASAAKALIAQVAGRPPRDVADLTAETIARHRVSEEGQSGMRAFLDRRPAPWTPDGQ